MRIVGRVAESGAFFTIRICGNKRDVLPFVFWDVLGRSQTLSGKIRLKKLQNSSNESLPRVSPVVIYEVQNVRDKSGFTKLNK